MILLKINMKIFFPFFLKNLTVLSYLNYPVSHSMFTLNVGKGSFRQEKVERQFECKRPPGLFLQTLVLWCTV